MWREKRGDIGGKGEGNICNMSLRHGKHGSEMRGPAMHTETCVTREMHKREILTIYPSLSASSSSSASSFPALSLVIVGHKKCLTTQYSKKEQDM